MGYQLSVKAADDLEKIWLYTLENWQLEQADKYINLLFDEMEYVSANPLSGKDISTIRENYRYTKVKSHLIFYRIRTATSIEIIRILHQRMDIENRLTE